MCKQRPNHSMMSKIIQQNMHRVLCELELAIKKKFVFDPVHSCLPIWLLVNTGWMNLLLHEKSLYSGVQHIACNPLSLGNPSGLD